jgi:hypothetical protein
MITKLYSLETDSYYKFLEHVIYHNTILSPLMTYHRNINKGNTTVAPVEQDLLTLSVHLACSRIPLVQYLVFNIVFFRLLFVFLSLFFWSLYCLRSYFGHCIVCFLLLVIVLSCLLLLVIVLSAFFEIRLLNYTFNIFKLFTKIHAKSDNLIEVVVGGPLYTIISPS